MSLIQYRWLQLVLANVDLLESGFYFQAGWQLYQTHHYTRLSFSLLSASPAATAHSREAFWMLGESFTGVYENRQREWRIRMVHMLAHSLLMSQTTVFVSEDCAAWSSSICCSSSSWKYSMLAMNSVNSSGQSRLTVWIVVFIQFWLFTSSCQWMFKTLARLKTFLIQKHLPSQHGTQTREAFFNALLPYSYCFLHHSVIPPPGDRFRQAPQQQEMQYCVGKQKPQWVSSRGYWLLTPAAVLTHPTAL